MTYFEVTREKMFPLAVIVSLLVCAIGAFLLFDAFASVTQGSASYLSRTRADLYYWLFYKYPEGTVSAYAATPTATSTDYARSIPVLLYHGESAATGNTPLATFIDQMHALKRDGWHTITLEQLQAFMKQGAKLPDKSFVLTFDDGRRDTFYPSDPVLKDLDYTAVMFVITGLSLPDQGKPQNFYLNKNELQYMVDSGRWELQSHGDMDHLVYHVQSTTDLTQKAKTVDGHFMSDKFWNDSAGRFETDAEFADRLRTDLTNAKKTLEKDFGQPVFTYAYPFNDFGQDTVNFPGATSVVAQVVPTIYTFSFYQHWPGNGDSFNYPDPNAYMIKRIEPHINWSGSDLIAALDEGRAKPLPYTATHFGNEWVGIWGTTSSGNTLSLTADADTSGATAFLDGSSWWRDYSFTTSVNLIAGESVALLARNQNDADYLACSYSTQSLTIERHTGTNQVDIAHARFSIAPGQVTLGMSAKGNEVQCFANGAQVGSATFSGVPSGGIGVQVWDHNHGVARSEFTAMNVQSL